MRTKKESNIKLSCKVKVYLDKKRQKPAKIIKLVEIYLTKYSLNYGSDAIMYMTTKNGKPNKTELDAKGDISNEINGGGIYFIFSQDNELFYIGKDIRLRERLKQHLISCSTSTSSHIKDVHNYLLDRKKQGKPLTIKYSAINTDDNKYNAAIEGALIDYCLNNCKKSYDKLWNKRED